MDAEGSVDSLGDQEANEDRGVKPPASTSLSPAEALAENNASTSLSPAEALAENNAVAAGSKSCDNGVIFAEAQASRRHGIYDIRRYFDSGAIILRYGYHRGTGFGFRHIRDKHGWSGKIRYCIDDTLRSGTCKYQGGSVTRIRCRKSYKQDDLGTRRCTFRVAHELNPAPGGPSGPVGIITAFFEGCVQL